MKLRAKERQCIKLLADAAMSNAVTVEGEDVAKRLGITIPECEAMLAKMKELGAIRDFEWRIPCGPGGVHIGPAHIMIFPSPGAITLQREIDHALGDSVKAGLSFAITQVLVPAVVALVAAVITTLVMNYIGPN